MSDEFSYHLPQEKIALHPISQDGQRSMSKLLISSRKGQIKIENFYNIGRYLPENSILVFNDTQVIPVRLNLQKVTGGKIEVFCLEPYETNLSFEEVLAKTKTIKYKCLIKKIKNWAIGQEIELIPINQAKSIQLKAKYLAKKDELYIIEFRWLPSEITFENLLDEIGTVPIPPYIKRAANIQDNFDYQTVYAQNKGAVAAPTAGLHFTKQLLNSLEQEGIKKGLITLHVGAGTFKPLKSKIKDHKMHEEKYIISKGFIKTLLEHQQKIIAVGTTSLRALESLYWSGIRIYLEPSLKNLHLNQLDWQELRQYNKSFKESLGFIWSWLERNNLNSFCASTSLLIMPSYKIKTVAGLISNFHQPNSTLLALIASLRPDWKEIYEFALNNNFRFLSYGDSCYFEI